MTRIPEMSNEVIEQRYERIKPVCRFGDKLHYIKHVDLYNIAFTWDPKKAQPAKGLKEIGQIETYHTYGYHGLFKPSVSEVLAQLPESDLERIVAFETGVGHIAIDNGYHRATTVLYGAK